jgi:hypothetical protein
MRLFKLLLLAQGTYILTTAIWPLIHIESFMFVTGPKQDIWLVKTVGALLIPIGICLLSFVFNPRNWISAMLLGLLTSLSFMIIDFYYSLTDVISDIYIVDGLLELVFLTGWLVFLGRHTKRNTDASSNMSGGDPHGLTNSS